jgi:hypothetical protein
VFATGGGPEGIAASPTRHRVYVHGPGPAIIALDTGTHQVTDRWPYACTGAHGIPALDDPAGLLLAGCGTGGEVHLLDVGGDGADLGKYVGGSGAALMAFSPTRGHLYARGDPGATIATLQPADGLSVLDTTTGSEAGHCLAADDRGHIWTGDEPGGRLLRLDDTAP